MRSQKRHAFMRRDAAGRLATVIEAAVASCGGDIHLLATAIGSDRYTLARWLGGTGLPTFWTIVELCELAGCSVDWLAYGTGKPPHAVHRTAVPIVQRVT